jgi:hypothetical protein
MCIPCIRGASCQNGNVTVDSGYFVWTAPAWDALSGSVQLQLFSSNCPTASMCPGGTLDQQCGANRVLSPSNALCGQCVPGYIEFQGSCIVCESADYALLALIVAALWIYVIFVHVSSGTSDGIIGVFLYFVQVIPPPLPRPHPRRHCGAFHSACAFS